MYLIKTSLKMYSCTTATTIKTLLLSENNYKNYKINMLQNTQKGD